MRKRWIQSVLGRELEKPFVHILFGARQTGKTTLLKGLLSKPSLHYNLMDPAERSRLLADPGALRQECEALPESGEPHVVFIDEAQNVPTVFDTVQVLYDDNKTRWRFVLCGSSARKLRKAGANLLPGRCLLHRLYPLIGCERTPDPTAQELDKAILPMPLHGSFHSEFPAAGILERLAYGDLPGIALLAEEDRASILKSFVTAHLEEEIRREALVNDWGAFVNFLKLAARESGQIVNYSSISQEVGLSEPTVKSHYELLKDLFIGFQVPAYTKSPRKNLLSTPRFYVADLGIRHAACGLTPGRELALVDPGRWFEQWVGIELWKRLQYLGEGQLHHLRTKGGAEIDFIMERGDSVTPIEAKWTDRPSARDARHVTAFIKENKQAREGFVVCRCPRPIRLNERVLAVPWTWL